MTSDTEGGNDQDKQREDRCGKKASPLLRIKSREYLVSRKADGDDKRIILDRSVSYQSAKVVAENTVRLEPSIGLYGNFFQQIGAGEILAEKGK